MKKIFTKFFVFTLVASFLLACGNSTAVNPNPEDEPIINPSQGDGEGEEIIKVTGITLPISLLTLRVGESYLLEHTIIPNNATNKNVSYFIHGESIRVDESGLITAYEVGTSTITIRTEDGGFAEGLQVIVKEQISPSDKKYVTSVTLDKHSLELKEGETYTLNATIEPDDATNKDVSWSTDNEAVATVNSKGKVTAVGEGYTKITVTTIDGGKVDYCNVKVNKVNTEPSEGEDEEPEEPLPAIDYVKLFALKDDYTHVYAWLGSGGTATTLVGSWPGTKLQEYDEIWNTYDFEGYTSLNFIFSNNGNNQTADLSVDHAGYYWYLNGVVTSDKPKIDDNNEPYTPPIDIPQGNYDLVEAASTANDLPAVKNYNKGQVLYPYKGSRDDFRDESIYFTITTRFYDGDKSNNTKCWDGRNNTAEDPAWRGDFKGLIEKMDYIKALGFTAIWITPVVKNASGYDYHGYHAINFKEVDPRYESEDVDFATVIQEAHKRDMKIILDVVFNHTGNFGEENLFPMFYYDSKNNTTIKGIITNKESGLLPSNYDSLPGGQQYSTRIDAMKGSSDAYNIYHHEKNMSYEQYIEQTGQMAGDCVDLNTENPTVANYLVEAYGVFIRLGVDAFRIDTMKHISRLTFNNYIWPGLYKIAEKCGNTHFYMFGEVCTRVREVWNHGQACDSAPFYTWKESKEYAWGNRAINEESTLANWNDNANTNQPTSTNAKLNGVNYHNPDYSRSSGCSVIDFPMHWNFQHARDAFGVAVGNDQYYNDATFNVTYVDSHDYGPDGAEKIRYNEGTNAWKENMSLIFTFRGVPCIYYGSEIEFQKGKTIDEGPNLALKDSGRAYYGDHLEGEVTATGFGEYNANGEVKNTLNSTLSKHLQMLNKIRLKVPALRRGQYTTSNVSGSGMAYTRRYTVGSIDSLACVTVSGGATFNSLPNGTYVDLVSGNRVTVSNGSLSANISGQGNVAIYVLENSSTGTLSKIQ